MRALAAILIFVSLAGVAVLAGQRVRWYQSVPLPRVVPPAIIPQRAVRPTGMAPVAWQAYLRACNNAKIHPFRVGQTVGDHPRSVGYHRRDGVLTINGKREEYSAAVDLGTWDLSEPKIQQFVDALAAQGFAAFYRSGGKWKGVEHIHAIYVFLPMKPQLQIQLDEFLTKRWRAGKRVKWEKKLRSQRRKLKHWML